MLKEELSRYCSPTGPSGGHHLIQVIIVEQIIEFVVEIRMHALLRLHAELEVGVRVDHLVDLHVVVTVQVRKHLVDDLLVFAGHLGRFCSSGRIGGGRFGFERRGRLAG